MPLRHLVLALTLLATAAPAVAAECGGQDLIAKVKAETPDKYAAFETAGQAIPNADGLLWRIEKDGKPASYLFGTMHTTEPDLVALSEPVKAALAQSSTVAVEIADANSAASQAAMVAYVTSNGIDLSGAALNGFAPEQITEIKRRLKGAGMPESIATVLKPWFLALTLEVSACELKKMSEGKPTVDATVEALGRAKGAEIVSLESVGEQLDAVSRISEETARKMIRESVAKPDGGDDQQATTLALYRARRVGWYFAMTKETFGEAMDLSSYADFVEGIVDKRNRLMTERVKPLLEKGSALIAVGALHLPGEKGLVELLRAEGYTLVKVW
ncbi:TraB/GumN family protein [Hansschlegelia quercus]|uniref:TraB/GumN family protein n=1 Tax=Hansschlegelia quercus TaxID=2528245 RepID=A0A4Q9GI51_9HYPH|nr:TraB/GumN family protein [Hansschlegelia quercus]TBN53762.1 TraB/GumN family protein [Hansschlegelia quercus]